MRCATSPSPVASTNCLARIARRPVLQSYLERAQGQPYMVAQQPIRFWMLVAFVHGVGVLAGAVMAIVHLLTLRPAPQADAPRVEGARTAGRGGRRSRARCCRSVPT